MGFKWIDWKLHDKPGDEWKDYSMAPVFFLVTAYLFIGIAIASDIFMNAIEKICGATRTVVETHEEDGVVVTTHREILVWNETVSNLTLMALGSSAPEILLSVIEISEGLGDQNPGDLGPGTIVGSASFNLMIIVAICTVCLKPGETSRVKMYNVFVFTCITSIFAYIWMVVVLQWNTTDQVDVWEGLVTLAFFPLLVIFSYWVDRDFCIPGKKKKRISTVSQISKGSEERELYFGDEDEDNLYDEDGNIRKVALENVYNKLNEIAILTPDEVATIIATKLIQSRQHRKSWYRVRASRAMLGYGTGMPPLSEKLKEVVEALEEGSHSSKGPIPDISSVLLKAAPTSPDTYNRMAVVEFQAAAIAVKEGVGTFKVDIKRSGKEDVGFQIKVESIDGSAKVGEAYEAVSETITFDPYVNENSVDVTVIDNKVWNPDRNFYLKLSILAESQEKALAGQMRVLQINIEDDDNPGKITLTKLGYLFKGPVHLGYVDVERVNGSDGKVSVKWRVVPEPNCTVVSAGQGGTIDFEAGMVKKSIQLIFHPVQGALSGTDQVFDVELYDPEGGAKLGKITSTKCAVTNDNSFKLQVTNVISLAIQKSEEAEEEITYKEQICQAVFPNDGDVKNATKKQWCLHILVFPFKVILSLIPPPAICGGWLCFIFALIAVGFLTKIVGETAGALGVCLRLNPIITAITFVALGTSLPDTFASVIAARNDKTADNSIGNVTGSNSVNVFLGLGLPWTIGVAYYKFYEGGHEPFCVPALKLTFNVVIFSLCAAVTIALLIFRRYSPLCGKAELGGPTVPKWVTSGVMMFMWFLYILIAYLETKNDKLSAPFVDNVTTLCELITGTVRYANGKPVPRKEIRDRLKKGLKVRLNANRDGLL